jgi:hypothetical protein
MIEKKTEPQLLWAWCIRGLIGVCQLIERMPEISPSVAYLATIEDVISRLQKVVAFHKQKASGTKVE